MSGDPSSQHPLPESRQGDLPYDQLAWILSAGVLTSVTVMIGGLLLIALRHESGAERPLPLSDVLGHALRLEGRGVLDLGILILFATPVLRVLTALAGFVRLGDRAFVAVTVVVLIFLGLSFAVASH